MTGGRREHHAPWAAWVICAIVLLLGLSAACTERPTTHHRPGTSHDVVTDPAGTLLPTEDGGHHQLLRQVPRRDAPAVTLTVRADAHDGWNLRLDVRRFRFSPGSVGGAAVLGSGHAHLFLDGRKIARLYGRWHHFSAGDVPAGSRKLTVRLYADDHTAWAVDGAPVEDSALLPGASPGGGSNQGDDAEREGEPSQDQADRTVEIAITKGAVSPKPSRIELRKGQRLALRVTSDADDELHVHGVNRSIKLTAGRTATLQVVLDRSGLFAVETHRSGLVLAQLAVR